MAAAKKSIPRARRNNYVPRWDDKCENLYNPFLQAQQGTETDKRAKVFFTMLDAK